MPQIGWFELLIIVIIAVLVIGPKDFPIVLRKIGNWIGSIKRYFNDIQKNVSDIEDTFEEDFSLEKNLLKTDKDKKKDE